MSEAAAASGGSGGEGEGENADFSATRALVGFLRSEADQAEEKARRLRAQSASLARKFGITDSQQSTYGIPPDQLPPLDENGVPRYKGRKRGRKPKPRKRKANPNRQKRRHTAYTLFVKETHPVVKACNPGLLANEIISIIAKRWSSELTPEEKKEWKARALATHNHDEEGGEGGADTGEGTPGTSAAHEDSAAVSAAAAAVEEDPEEEVGDDEDDEEEAGEEADDDAISGEADEDIEDDREEFEVIPPARRSRRSRRN